jgi:hypothetical protein
MAKGTMRLEGAAQPWADSSARYRVATEHEGTLLTVAVRCRITGLPFDSQALLDTGAAWSVVGGDLADMLQAQLDTSGQTMILNTYAPYSPLYHSDHRIDHDVEPTNLLQPERTVPHPPGTVEVDAALLLAEQETPALRMVW